MEKILVVMNAHKPDMDTIDFACRMASIAGTRLTGLFIDNVFFEYATPDIGLSYFHNTGKSRTLTADVEQTVRIFKDECLKNGIDPEVYIDQGEAIQETIQESRFADLMILEPGIGFFSGQEPPPSHFAREILQFSECPILLAPRLFDGLDEITFCYDGSASAVFAIKQFTYLFPELADKKVMLLEINRSSREEFDEKDRRMMVWLRAHYKMVYYHSLKGDVKDELFAYFFMKRKTMIVMGAYGRSIISQLLRKSNADRIIRTVDLPLFVTHH